MPLNKIARSAGPRRLSRNAAPFEGPLGALERERARLQEEVLQLRAAVHIWKDVYRHTMAASSDASPAEHGE